MGIEGRVVLQALVDAHGRVKRSTIFVLHTSHPQFADPARHAFGGAEFLPGWLAGMRIEAWVTFSVYFDLYSEWHYARR